MKIQLNEQLSISKLVIGCMRMNDWNLSVKQSVEFIEWCIERGITTFDHADIYGGDHRNEALFGEALKMEPSLREKIQIVTKCAISFPNAKNPHIKTRFFNTDKPYILEQVNDSLDKLHCGYVDILLIHMFDLLSIRVSFMQLSSSLRMREKSTILAYPTIVRLNSTPCKNIRTSNL